MMLSSLLAALLVASGGAQTASADASGYLNRAEFIALTMQTVGDGGGGTYCFRDVGAQWYAAPVCAAKNRGLVRGYPDNTFRPANRISFAEAGAVALRAYGVSVGSDAVWYRPYMAKLGEYGAFPRSVSNITFGITREQAVEMLAEIRNGKDNESDDEEDDDDISSGDLTISITDDDDTVDTGDTITYTIRIENDGDDDEHVDVRAILDDETTFVSADNGGDHDGDEVEWDSLLVREDDEKTLKLKVRVRSSADDGDTVTLKVEAEGEDAEEDTEVNDDNDDDDDDDDDGDEDVTVSVDVDDSTVEEGDTIVYSIRLENDGNDEAVVDVRAELDEDVSFVSASESGDEDDEEVTWDNLRLDEDEILTLKLRVRVDSSADDGDTITLDVEAGDDEDSIDVDVVDNDDSDDEGDISISVSDTDDPVDVGDTVTYRIRLTNEDDDRAKVDLRAFLDDGMSYVSSTDGGDLDNDDEVEWNDLSVLGDDEKTVLLTVRFNSSADEGDVLRLRIETDDDTATETTEVGED